MRLTSLPLTYSPRHDGRALESESGPLDISSSDECEVGSSEMGERRVLRITQGFQNAFTNPITRKLSFWTKLTGAGSEVTLDHIRQDLATFVFAGPALRSNCAKLTPEAMKTTSAHPYCPDYLEHKLRGLIFTVRTLSPLSQTEHAVHLSKH